MLLRYFYDKPLAHASYLVGCQRTGTAIVIDPGRDVERYLAAAEGEGLRLTAVAETHIHADYVSGAHELADRLDLKLYLSDEGPAEWKYEYAIQYDHQLVKDGDSFTIGNLRFDVLHTPGHTPESVSFLLTDRGAGANAPMGIFTGDFVFVGSIGRPDLLEEAAGIVGTAEPGARDLYRSIERFRQLPDFLQVWPAHGAGSACGKGLGAVPSSTVGYEKRFNPALQYEDPERFVSYILADQPEAPPYFALMKRVNRVGPTIVGPEPAVPVRDIEQLQASIDNGTVIDLSPADRFATSHVPGTLNLPITMLATWAGWLLDYERPVFLLGHSSQVAEASRILRKIGVDEIAGAFDTVAVERAGTATQSYQQVSPTEAKASLDAGEATLIDVRNHTEWSSERIPGAEHHFLGKLPDHLDQLPDDQPLIIHCQGGARSAIATSLLQAAGKKPRNLKGGFLNWKQADLPTTSGDEPVATR